MADQATIEPESDAYAHALARRAMRLLEHRDEADLRVVFAALTRRVRPAEGDGRREAALRALDQCAGELGVTAPTMRRYEAWRHTSDTGHGAPSTQQIRTLFDGSWSRAVAAMPSVPAADPLAMRLTALGHSLSDAECVDAIARWHAETGERTEKSYRVWARRVRETERGARLPAGGGPVRDRFGSWPATLAVAGISPARVPRSTPIARPVARRATRPEITEALIQAYREIGEPFTAERYRRWVAQQASEHSDSIDAFRLGDPQVVTRVLGGTWHDAITEVFGAESAAHAAAVQRVTRFTDADVHRAWWACRSALGGQHPSITSYEQWRHEQAQTTGFTVWPPGEGTIRARNRGKRWGQICDMFESQGQPADEGDAADG